MFPNTKPEGRKHETSCMNVLGSEAEFHEFTLQVEETTAFLEAYKEELLRLRGFPGIEGIVIDFGIARRDVIVQSDFLPPSLIRLAAELGLGILLTQYPIKEDEEPDCSTDVS